MEYHVQFDHPLPSPDAIEDAIRGFDMAATIAIDAPAGRLRVATWIVVADLMQALAQAGEPVRAEQVVQQPSVCCGDCSG